MKTGIFNARRHARVGPGGWNCHCCGPAPRYRKLFVKIHEKRIQKILAKLNKEN